MDYLLEDITVIDAATFLAGPGAATILADYGANVIKIEPPDGDGYRTLVGRYPVPYHWLLTSRNKRSLAVDISREEGQTLMHRLIEKADVFTTNFFAAQLEKYGLEYERLKEINPRLIYAHVSGYGLEGPEKDRRSFDITAWWARSGLMEFIRDPGQTPLAAAPGMGDHATASTLFGAIMTGLYRREKTGEGCFVSTSLAANGAWANGMLLQGVVAGNDAGTYRQARGWPNPFTGCYRTKDGKYLVFSIVNPVRDYPRLCQALDRPDWQDDNRFVDGATVMRNKEDFSAELQKHVETLDYADVAACLDEADVTYGPVQPLADVLEDEQLRANNIVVETGDDGDDYKLTINSPIDIREEPRKAPSRAPDVGADSVTVLTELGFEASYIDDLRERGVVIQP